MPETMEYRVAKVEERVAENETKNAKQHERFFRELEEIRIHNATTDEKQAQILSGITKIENKVDALQAQPGQKMDKIWTAIVAALASGIIGGIIGMILL